MDYSVYTAGMDINMVEQQISNLQTLNATLGEIDPTCVDNYFRYACSFYYPRCGESTAERKYNITFTMDEHVTDIIYRTRSMDGMHHRMSWSQRNL